MKNILLEKCFEDFLPSFVWKIIQRMNNDISPKIILYSTFNPYSPNNKSQVSMLICYMVNTKLLDNKSITISNNGAINHCKKYKGTLSTFLKQIYISYRDHHIGSSRDRNYNSTREIFPPTKCKRNRKKVNWTMSSVE